MLFKKLFFVGVGIGDVLSGDELTYCQVRRICMLYNERLQLLKEVVCCFKNWRPVNVVFMNFEMFNFCFEFSIFQKQKVMVMLEMLYMVDGKNKASR